MSPSVYTAKDVRWECRVFGDHELLVMHQHDALALAALTQRDPDDPFIALFQTRVDGLAEEIEHRSKVARFWERRGGRLPKPATDDLYGRLLDRTQELRERYPIDRFLSEMFHSELHRTSKDRFKTQCILPGHHDHDPSMVVYPEGKTWCFVCQAGGDIFDLTQSYFGLGTFWDAVQKLSECAGLDPLEAIPSAGRNVPENRSFPTDSPKVLGNRERFTVKLNPTPYVPFQYSPRRVSS